MRYSALLLFIALTTLPFTTFAQDTAEWTTIERFTGQSVGMSSFQTAPFEVEADHWRAKWTMTKVRSQLYASMFQVELHQPGRDWEGETLASMANEGRASNTTHRYESGQFYLKIQEMNADWALKIQVPNK